jgi:hypothetical protein
MPIVVLVLLQQLALLFAHRRAFSVSDTGALCRCHLDIVSMWYVLGMALTVQMREWQENGEKVL